MSRTTVRSPVGRVADRFAAARRRLARRLPLAWLSAGIVLCIAAGAAAQDKTGTVPKLEGEFQTTSHKVVLITDQALNPRLVTLDRGQLVAWISYSKAPSQIVFEKEIAKDMICHSLVNFSLKDDELRSAPIHAGEFASFCQLKPGRYRYNVVRPSALERDDARRRLRGEIIVSKEE